MPQANKPAMTSGPGAQSRRTDGGPASKQAMRYVSGMPNYGDGQAMSDLQASAPMAKTPDVKPLPEADVNAAMTQGKQAIPFNAPTQNPGEPVTSGAALGAGAGIEALGLNSAPTDEAFKAKLAMYMPVLSYIASREDTSPETRQTIRQLGNML
jgi:hypothetical protein